MAIYSLTEKGFEALLKFASTDSERDPLTGVFFENIDKNTLRLTATDGHKIITGLFERESVESSIKKYQQQKVGGYDPKNSIFYSAIGATDKKITNSVINSTKVNDYPYYTKLLNNHFEYLKDGYTPTLNAKYLLEAQKLAKLLFGKNPLSVMFKYQIKGNNLGLVIYSPDKDYENIIGLMPIRENKDSVNFISKEITVTIKNGDSESVKLSGVRKAHSLAVTKQSPIKKMSGYNSLTKTKLLAVRSLLVTKSNKIKRVVEDNSYIFADLLTNKKTIPVYEKVFKKSPRYKSTIGDIVDALNIMGYSIEIKNIAPRGGLLGDVYFNSKRKVAFDYSKFKKILGVE